MFCLCLVRYMQYMQRKHVLSGISSVQHLALLHVCWSAAASLCGTWREQETTSRTCACLKCPGLTSCRKRRCLSSSTPSPAARPATSYSACLSWCLESHRSGVKPMQRVPLLALLQPPPCPPAASHLSLPKYIAWVSTTRAAPQPGQWHSAKKAAVTAATRACNYSPPAGLRAVQVYAVPKHKPADVLHRLHQNLTRASKEGDSHARQILNSLRVVAAGGDGTLSWVLQAIK